jgi:hypothetical protein
MGSARLEVRLESLSPFQKPVLEDVILPQADDLHRAMVELIAF